MRDNYNKVAELVEDGWNSAVCKVLENSSVYFLHLDNELNLLRFNKTFARDFQLENFSGKLSLLRFISSEDQVYIKNNAKEASLNPGRPVRFINTLHSTKLGARSCQLEFVAFVNQETAHNINILCLGEDLTELIEQKQKLERLAEKNALQTQSLLNFAYSISHNLRSHVANLLSLFEIKENGLMTAEEEGQFYNMVKKNLERLDKTISDLNYIVFYHHDTTPIKEVVSVNDSVNVVLNSIMAAINESRATIINTIRPNTKLRTVPAYFESILLNLLTNAIKYRHPDRDPLIKLSFYSAGDYKVLEVKDNGRGIDLNRYGDKIFNLFRTFHGNTDARGLGLYLCRLQAEAMGGNISVISVPDKGSTFKVFFHEAD
jgi:signal transduction histidine kinase